MASCLLEPREANAQAGRWHALSTNRGDTCRFLYVAQPAR